jgi:hypothetical protein
MSITLNALQQHRKNIILSGLAGKLTNKQMSQNLLLCIRRICAIKAKYKKVGDIAFIHANTGRSPVNKTGADIKKRIIEIKEEERNGEKVYEKVNFSHFTEILNDYYNIKSSRSNIGSILQSAGFKSPKIHRIKKDRILHPIRQRKCSFGELVQADGSPFDWLGDGKLYTIQGFVDDATGIPLGLYMTKHECLLGYLEATRQMLLKNGIPEQLYPDRSGIFFINHKNKNGANGEKRDKKLTQFGRIMEELGVDMFPAYSPQAKGRIERFWETIQSRLPVELKMRGIKTVEGANLFLPEFIKRFSRRFGVKPLSEETKFVPLTLTDINRLNDLLVVKIKRKVDSGGVISVQGYKFLIADCKKKEVIIALSEKFGIWATTTDGKKHRMELLEADSDNPHMPEVQKDLIHEYFLKDTKAKYREVYRETG